MGWFGRLLGRAEAKSVAPEEAKAVGFDAAMWAAINGGFGMPTRSGASVSTDSAMQVTAFYRAMVVIAEGIAQLPIEIYRRHSGGRGAEPAVDHPLYDLLLNQPSAIQDAFQFWRTTLMHAAGAGHGVSYKNIVAGQVRELIPIPPSGISVRLDHVLYTRVYDLTFETGGGVTVRQDQVFDISGPTWVMRRPLDPSIVGREALGLAQATEETHARLHANSARPSGVLSTEQRLDEAAVNALRAQWEQIYRGTQNSSKTAVLGGGLTWNSIAMTGVDSQHIETRKHQIEEIARLMGMFPIMLGHAGDQSPTFASAAEFFAAHVRYTLQPWMKAVRSAVETQLLTKEERADGYHCRIDASELMRGSLKDRADYYKAALGTNSSPGWLRPNEVREDDGWNPDDEPSMDRVWQPATMSPDGRPAAPAAPATDESKAATPRTLYVCRRLRNADEVLAWARKQGFRVTLPAEDLHVTIAFSRGRVDWMSAGVAWLEDRDGGLTVKAGGPRVVERIGSEGAVALLFASYDLSARHRDIREAGATWDHPDYQPHVTITYDADGVDLAKVEPFRGELRFGPELFSEVDETKGGGPNAGLPFEAKYRPDQPRGPDGRFLKTVGEWIGHLLSGRIKPQGKAMSLGSLPKEVDAFVRNQGVVPARGPVRVTDNTVLKAMRTAGKRRPPSVQDMQSLKEHLAAPAGRFWDVNNRTLVSTFRPARAADGLIGKIAIRLDTPDLGRAVRTVILVPEESVTKNPRAYIPLKG
ncbi:hypothetical protein STAQ_27780 [Allostella sp. ATCC 35155]|nr:hypothetical protein STAQ_27780 [Stella sp. ATCC 35155]